VKKSSLIGHVVELYQEVSGSPKPADHLIDKFFRSRKYLGSNDRKFIAETVYGVLRHKKRIEWALFSFGREKIELYSCLAFLILEKRESVETLHQENIVPRDILDRIKERVLVEPTFPSFIETVSAHYSFQEWMIQEWNDTLGGNALIPLCECLNTQAPMSIRVNTIKSNVQECQNELLKEGIGTEPTQFSPVGLHLKKRINIFQLQSFKKGLFEVQDEGSQLLALLVDPKPRAKVVDACAGAGGKSLAMASIMKNRGEIFALDIHSFRLDDLRKRIKRSGVDIIRVKTIMENTAISELVGTVDNVLVDAPCSGTGTIRRNPGMKWSVSARMVREMHEKQFLILSLNAQYVKPQGRLIYSTCSLMKHENEEVVERFLATHPEFELLSPSKILERYQLATLANNEYFQLLPHHHNTDGFFAAAMRRKN
jgi:16S rRNA (cytosine967-C5)-methyltransferase